MKKITKQRIGVLIVASIFLMSTIAYVLTSTLNPQAENKELENFVIEGELDPAIENEYLRNGFTSMRFYYSDNDFIFFLDNLPKYMKTGRNQVQLIVQKIESNETYAVITGPYGEEEIRNVTQDNLFNALCDILLDTPVECGYERMNLTTKEENTTV